MAHAETCPVCGGSGEKRKEIPGDCVTVSCHGCDGKGWVEIGSDSVVVPCGPYVSQPWPVHEPTITIGDWVYESGIYSANVEITL